MSYFDQKQRHYTEILHLIDKTVSSGGSIKDIRETIVERLEEIDEIKSQI
jgi:hypothetical protein